MGQWNTKHHPHLEYSTIYLEAGRPYRLLLEHKHREVEYPHMK